MSIKLYIGYDPIEVQIPQLLIFPGGEPHVRISRIEHTKYSIDARLTDMDELGKLLVLTDALRHNNHTCKLDLYLPYFPGARQDRIAPGSGNALTARVFANIINAQNYDNVYVLDPHSDVTPALLDRCHVIWPNEWVMKFIQDTLGRHFGYDKVYIVNPDAGAEKRNHWLSVRGFKMITATKERSPEDGRIVKYNLPQLSEIPDNAKFIVVDDLCDGGATFEMLNVAMQGQQWHEKGSYHLFVTHGIFSKGFSRLLECYDSIGCTDSWDDWDYEPSHEEHVQVQKLTLESMRKEIVR